MEFHTLIGVDSLQKLLGEPRLAVVDCRFDLMNPGAGRQAGQPRTSGRASPGLSGDRPSRQAPGSGLNVPSAVCCVLWAAPNSADGAQRVKA